MRLAEYRGRDGVLRVYSSQSTDLYGLLQRSCLEVYPKELPITTYCYPEWIQVKDSDDKSVIYVAVGQIPSLSLFLLRDCWSNFARLKRLRLRRFG